MLASICSPSVYSHPTVCTDSPIWVVPNPVPGVECVGHVRTAGSWRGLHAPGHKPGGAAAYLPEGRVVRAAIPEHPAQPSGVTTQHSRPGREAPGRWLIH